MMCYRDMTFCSSDCVNSGCGRFVSEDVLRKATAWTQSFAPTLDYPLLAKGDFSPDCEDYQPPKEVGNE